MLRIRFYCNYRLIIDIGMPKGFMSGPRKQPMESERQLACRDIEIELFAGKVQN